MVHRSTGLRADPAAAEGQTLRTARPAVQAARDVPKAPAADRNAGPDVTIALDATLFLRASLGCIALLAALALAVAYLVHVREADLPRLIPRGLLFDEEANIPTFLAFGLLLFCSVLLALIAARAFLARQAFRFHWALLAALFLLIAFDEAAALHERLSGPVRAALDASGWLYFAWIVPFGGFVAVLALLYLPFLRRLPAPFGRLFVLSAALYVGGALGMEMPGAAYYEAHGKRNFTYQLLTTVEETLEMLGAAVFGYALMRFLAHAGGGVRLAFRTG